MPTGDMQRVCGMNGSMAKRPKQRLENTSSNTGLVCNLGQVISPLCVSLSPSLKLDKDTYFAGMLRGLISQCLYSALQM